MVNDRFLLNQCSLGWLLLIALMVLGAGLGLRDEGHHPDEEQGSGGEGEL